MRTTDLSAHAPLTDTAEGTETVNLVGRRAFLSAGLSMLGIGVLSGCAVSDAVEEKVEELTNEQVLDDSSSDAYPELTEALNQLEIESGFQLTLSLYEYPTDGSEEIQYNFKPEYQSYEASLAKVPIALSVLRKLNEEGREFDEETFYLMNASLGYSDNDSTQALFESLGEDAEQQAAYLNATYANLGITSTYSEGDWGINLTSAQDQMVIARAVNDGVEWIRGEDFDRLREIMLATNVTQTWGVGAAGEDMGADYVLCKNGWIQDEDTAQWYINTMGVVNLNGRRFAVAALNFGAAADQQETGYGYATRAVDAALNFFSI